MTARRTGELAARSLLAVIFATAASAKLSALLGWAGHAPQAGGDAPCFIAALGELALAALLLLPRVSAAAALLAALAFLGAGLATAVYAATHGVSTPCRCLGRIALTRGQALIAQGAIVLLAGVVFSLQRSRNVEEPRS